ncbi:MAG TPA: DUF4157 domain-containing protein, partial [Allosphingosinicella sp.]|nr:DUF4157 domain-containing protein [Allosphingosinicella sp.]
PATRAYFEPRFGTSFADVRVHADSAGAAAAHAIGARAFALGRHIGFAAGQYAPDSRAGRALLAHELAHTLQSQADNTIRRTCPSNPAEIPPGTATDFEARAQEAAAHATFRNLSRRHQQLAEHIIDGARGSPCPMYYITQLLRMFNTPVASSTTFAANQRTMTGTAVAAEQARLAGGGASQANVEEDLASAPTRQFTSMRGEDGTTYQVDNTDPNNVIVRLRVQPVARGRGNAEDVRRTISLEDGIEKASGTRGYSLDVNFVQRGGADVFTVGVDPSRWTTSRNWVGEPRTIAHEAHHLLGLEDRYNYIRSHTANANMAMGDRLWWFREQMVRPPDATAGQSMMANHHQLGTVMTEEDICAVAGGDYERCLRARFAALPVGELVSRATQLNSPYRPQHAALLSLLASAWVAQIQSLQLSIAPATGGPAPPPPTPPTAWFGDPAVVASDALRFPLHNPHRQAPGSSLPRRRR